MLSRSSRLVGRCPSWSFSSSSSISEDESELEILKLLRFGRDLLPSSSSIWVSDDARSCSGPLGLAGVPFDDIDTLVRKEPRAL